MANSEQEILSGLAEIVNEETGLPVDSVELDKSFTDDLDIDSLSMMTIVVNAESLPRAVRGRRSGLLRRRPWATSPTLHTLRPFEELTRTWPRARTVVS